MTDKILVRCRECGRNVASRVPPGGDGSTRKPYRHKRPDGSKCDGHLFEGKWVGLQQPK